MPVKNNFLIKKLGLANSPALMEAIKSVIDKHGQSEKNTQLGNLLDAGEAFRQAIRL